MQAILEESSKSPETFFPQNACMNHVVVTSINNLSYKGAPGNIATIFGF